MARRKVLPYGDVGCVDAESLLSEAAAATKAIAATPATMGRAPPAREPAEEPAELPAGTGGSIKGSSSAATGEPASDVVAVAAVNAAAAKSVVKEFIAFSKTSLHDSRTPFPGLTKTIA